MSTQETDFNRHLAAFNDDLKRLQGVAHENLGSDVALIAEMEGSHLVGGKRLRAVVALLCGRLCGVAEAQADTMATAIEFIHTATLLHDDVVDEAPVRRGAPAAARVYGNAAAVLAGDFLYSRASQMLASLDNVALLQKVAASTNKLAEGELMQLQHRGEPEMDEETYYAIIGRKTANLFDMAASAAAIVAGQDADALSRYGRQLGMAFQLVDDCLDYEGEDTGKKIGTDFSEGKMTLPMIFMLQRIDPAQRDALTEDWRAGSDAMFTQAAAWVKSTGAIESVRRRAEEAVAEAVAAVQHYPPSPARDALIALAQASPRRLR